MLSSHSAGIASPLAVQAPSNHQSICHSPYPRSTFSSIIETQGTSNLRQKHVIVMQPARPRLFASSHRIVPPAELLVTSGNKGIKEWKITFYDPRAVLRTPSRCQCHFGPLWRRWFGRSLDCDGDLSISRQGCGDRRCVVLGAWIVLHRCWRTVGGSLQSQVSRLRDILGN